MSCGTASASPPGGHSQGDRRLPRSEIAASWERSTRAGVRRDRLHVTCDPDIDLDGRVVHAARPVLGWLSRDLAGVPVTVVLADDRGRLLDDPVGGPKSRHPEVASS